MPKAGTTRRSGSRSLWSCWQKCRAHSSLRMTESTSNETLRDEFDRWAEAGRGAEMEQDHLPITLPVLEKMRLAPTDNVLDVGCGAGWLPWQPHFFAHAISVESSYYWPDPAAGIKDIFRVLHDGGSAWILINYYRDNPHCHQWGELLAVPTHLLSGDEWAELFRNAGFTNVVHERIVDPSPSPATYTGRWFRDAEQLRAFKAEGALLIRGAKG